MILVNAKKNNLKLNNWPSVNWGLCIQRAIAEKTSKDRMLKLFLFEIALSLL